MYSFPSVPLRLNFLGRCLEVMTLKVGRTIWIPTTGFPLWYVPGTAMTRSRTFISRGETYCSSMTVSSLSCLPSRWNTWMLACPFSATSSGLQHSKYPMPVEFRYCRYAKCTWPSALWRYADHVRNSVRTKSLATSRVPIRQRNIHGTKGRLTASTISCNGSKTSNMPGIFPSAK